ncbi:hypothetical protein Pcinc_000411 [Petrolisthes cinctipes]|uniref:Uncharacterized protein n=1 Tax=Petrolisthes cinctipes TaxID=88211 RepID=A0AAE1L4F4_PETCI|nr:hypothetical protein Pcinc_000411 [Petrolisthes cinctipes]
MHLCSHTSQRPPLRATLIYPHVPLHYNLYLLGSNAHVPLNDHCYVPRIYAHVPLYYNLYMQCTHSTCLSPTVSTCHLFYAHVPTSTRCSTLMCPLLHAVRATHEAHILRTCSILHVHVLHPTPRSRKLQFL